MLSREKKQLIPDKHFQDPKRGQTRVKHAVIKRFLGAKVAVHAQSKNTDVIIVDGFAGSGTYGSNDDSLDGGPIPALDDSQMGSPLIIYDTVVKHHLLHNFRAKVHLYFIEANECHFQKLKMTLTAHMKEYPKPPNVEVHLVNGSFHIEMPKILEKFPNAFKQPLLVFVDPFGIKGVPMDLMQLITGRYKAEVIVSLMYGYVNRFIANSKVKYQNNFKELLGLTDNEWAELRHVLRDGSRPSAERQRAFRDCYVQQLEKRPSFESPQLLAQTKLHLKFSMRNVQNRCTYDLIYITGHIKGIKEMKRAMLRQVQRTSTDHDHFYFSEFDERKLMELQENGQATTVSKSKWVMPELMSDQELLDDLVTLITSHFQKQWRVTAQEVENFIWLQTPHQLKRGCGKVQLRTALRPYLAFRPERFAFGQMVFDFAHGPRTVEEPRRRSKKSNKRRHPETAIVDDDEFQPNLDMAFQVLHIREESP